MLKIKKLLSVVLAVSMIATLSISAFASNSTTNNSFEVLEDIAKNSVEITDTQKISNAKDIVQNNNLTFNYLDAELDFENAIVLDTNAEGEIYTSITIPVVGQDYSILSNVTCTIIDDEIVAYSESLITTGDDGNLVINNYANGTFLETVETGVYLSDKEIEEELDRLSEIVKKTSLQRGAGEIAGCLAALLGIDVTLAAVLVGMCSGSCPAVPVVCAACVGAVAAVGVGNMELVAKCFSL